jgi:hypothetical protein
MGAGGLCTGGTGIGLGGSSTGGRSGSRQLNQYNPAERLREGLRLFFKLKINAYH